MLGQPNRQLSAKNIHRDKKHLALCPKKIDQLDGRACDDHKVRSYVFHVVHSVGQSVVEEFVAVVVGGYDRAHGRAT